MSKTKSKNRSEVEYLRGEVKRLKSQLSSTNKRNKQLERRAHFYEDTVVEVAEDIDIDTCTQCGKGTIQVLDLGHIKLLSCNLCEFRERIREHGKKTES